MSIEELVVRQHRFFDSNATKSLAFRQAALTRLLQLVSARQDDIAQALYQDLGKSSYESYMTETGLVLDEIRYARSHLSAWMRPQSVPCAISQFPANCKIYHEPYGVSLIMAPWNYPFQLTMIPLTAALAAGNCAVVKPSAYAPATSQIIADIISTGFRNDYVAVVQGGRQENTELLKQHYDYIFFTGSVAVGKLVMASAAENLTPVTLELGGKSPVIIDETADLAIAARRIVFGKLINAGQTCVAPDYCYVNRAVHDAFIANLKHEIVNAIGTDSLNNPEYPHIVDAKHYAKVMGLINANKVIYGGNGDGQRIEPTIIDNATYDDACMQNEIFGPILPIISYDSLDDVIKTIKAHDKPLACYIFTNNRQTKEKLLSSLSFGGGCVNDTLLHLTSHNMPFGGVGASGMGNYHGHFGFETFSHQKSVVDKALILDNSLRYHPYSQLKDRLLKLFMPSK